MRALFLTFTDEVGTFEVSGQTDDVKRSLLGFRHGGSRFLNDRLLVSYLDLHDYKPFSDPQSPVKVSRLGALVRGEPKA